MAMFKRIGSGLARLSSAVPPGGQSGGVVFTKLPNPAVLPSLGQNVAFSPEGDYLAVQLGPSTPIPIIYARAGDTFTSLSVTGAASGLGRCDLAPGGDYFAATGVAAPGFSLHKRSGGSFARMADPAIVLGGGGSDVSFSRNGLYLAVISTSGSRIEIVYKRAGDVFSALPPLTPAPNLTRNSCQFSPNNEYLAFGGQSGRLAVYKRSGDAFTSVVAPTDSTGTLVALAWSPGSDYLAAAVSGSGGSGSIRIYKRAGDIFTLLPEIALPGTGRDVSFSRDGQYLAVAHATAPFFTVFRRQGDTFTRLLEPVQIPPGSGNGIAFSPASRHLAVAHTTTPFVSIYKQETSR